FEENKKNIEKQAYQDSEMTQLHSQSRGIQNSQQMLGLMQGDNARRDSLINTNVTERDRRVADVKDRLNMIKNQSKLQMASASAQHGYGLAGARGQADAQMYQNMFNMNFDDYKMNREQQFALDKGQLDHENNKQLQAQQQAYTLENMNLQQRYTLEQFATQHGYKLGEMSVEQTYRLAQMAQQNGYDVGMLEMQQGFEAGQNALDRSHSWGMQQSQQERQSGEKFLDRMHDMDMLTQKGRAEAESMQAALEQELASYTDKNSTAYKLREEQGKAAIGQFHMEQNHKMLSDIMGKDLAEQVGKVPVLPKKATGAEWNKYSAEVDAYNAKLIEFAGNKENAEKFMRLLPKAPYAGAQQSALGKWWDFLRIAPTKEEMRNSLP